MIIIKIIVINCVWYYKKLKHFVYFLIDKLLNIFRGKKIVISMGLIIYYSYIFNKQGKVSFELFWLICMLCFLLLVLKEYLDRMLKQIITILNNKV